MNKVLNINLGGYPLTIDDDAYEHMRAYLDSIRVRFNESEGRDEIMKDIEMRLGELLNTELGTRRIVMLPDVEEVIQILGKPEDYGGEPVQHSPSSGGKSKKSKKERASGGGVFGIKPGRRLFRDNEDKVAGGVCAGFSAYLGISDPLWLRLAFVLLTFISAGFWVPAYLIFWALVPEAKTAADRLAMRGETINVDNIAKEVEHGFGNLGDQMGAMGEEAKKQGRETAGQVNEALAQIVGFIGKAFAWVIRFLGQFGIALLVLLAIALVFGLLSTWMAGIWTFFAALPFIGFFSPHSSGVNYLGAFNLFLLITIPIIGMIMTLSALLFKVKAPGWVSFLLGAVWFINLFSIMAIGGTTVQSYSQQSTVEKMIDISSVSSDTLLVKGLGEDVSFQFDDGKVRIDGNLDHDEETLTFPNQIDIRVQRGRTDQFRAVQVTTARGASVSEARLNAELVDFPVRLEGNVLTVPKVFMLKKGQGWRNQKIRLNIEVPRGKSIVFDEQIYDNAKADLDDYAPGERKYISRNANQVYTMTAQGLACSDCPKWGDEDYDDYKDYEHFTMIGGLDAEIRKGERFSFELDEKFRDQVEVIHTGDHLTFDASSKTTEGDVPLLIYTETFTSLLVEGDGKVVIRGFDEGRASITAKGNPVIKGYLNCRVLDVNLQGANCKLELNGKGRTLEGNLADGAVLDAFGWKLEDAKMSLSGASVANLYVSKDAAEIKTDDGSKVNFQGN